MLKFGLGYMMRLFGRKNPEEETPKPTTRTFSAPFDQKHWNEAQKIVDNCFEDDNRDVVWMVALGVQRGEELEKLNDL